MGRGDQTARKLDQPGERSGCEEEVGGKEERGPGQQKALGCQQGTVPQGSSGQMRIKTLPSKAQTLLGAECKLQYSHFFLPGWPQVQSLREEKQVI